MEILGTARLEPGRATSKQQSHFTSTYKHVKAAIASGLMWLSMVGGLL